jgi:hypothetical protein
MHCMERTHKSETVIFHVRFEVFTVVTMKNDVFWDVAPCSSYINRRFGGTYRLHFQGREMRERGTSMNQQSATICLCWFLARGFYQR